MLELFYRMLKKKKPIKKKVNTIKKSTSKEIIVKKPIQPPVGQQAEITYNDMGEPKRTPNGIKAYWIITVRDIDQFIFRGTADQCRLESNRLYSLYGNKHRTNTRYADQEEINQNKPLRPTSGKDIVRLFRQEMATFNNVLYSMGIVLTPEEKKLLAEKSRLRELARANLSAKNKENYHNDNKLAWEKLHTGKTKPIWGKSTNESNKTATIAPKPLETPKISDQDGAGILSMKKDKGKSLKSRQKAFKQVKKKK